ncbi:GHKL domain-containing protein [Enterococcus sp.]|uniref:GHKL domain-containing protein n=1 Tax=Enterococcus sp. TaxID=35783 RepID=UPI0029148725|nr:GHKL domain-containing protein [Enterococcus sp.]MDU5337096.1 GHKL domain-containing protein [Enterococcus sp.]
MNINILEFFISISSSALENIIIYQYFSAVLIRKKSIWYKEVWTFFLGLLMLFTSTQFIESPFTRIGITTVTLLAYTTLYFGKNPIKLLLIISYISLAAVAEELAASAIMLITKTPFLNSYIDRALSILVASIFLIILIELLSSFVFKVQKIIYFESKIYYALIPLSSLTLTLIFFFDLRSVGYKIMALMLIGGINLCFFVLLKTIAVSLETKNKLIQREIELKYQRRIAQKKVQQFKEVRAKTHDTNKYLVLVKGLLKNNQIDKAILELDNYLSSVNSSLAKSSTNHIAIDSMIDYCYELSGKNQIAVRLEANILNKDFDIDDVDVSVLLGNIIDNALEANIQLKETSERWLELDLVTNHKHMYVCAANPYKGTVNINKTSKANNNQHGFGLITIQEIVKKYDGVIDIDTKNNCFKVLVVLPYN